MSSPNANPVRDNTDRGEVLADPIPVASRNMGIGRTRLYLEHQEGRLEFIKVGKRTLISREEQRRWLAAQPRSRGKAA